MTLPEMLKGVFDLIENAFCYLPDLGEVSKALF